MVHFIGVTQWLDQQESIFLTLTLSGVQEWKVMRLIWDGKHEKLVTLIGGYPSPVSLESSPLLSDTSAGLFYS